MVSVRALLRAPLLCLPVLLVVGTLAGLVSAGPILDGQRIYLSTGTRLTIVNVAAPATPTLLGYYSVPSSTLNSVAVSGTTAYLGTDAGLTVVDVTTPTLPLALTALGIGPVVTTTLTGDRLFAGSVGMTAVFSITNAVSPTLLGNLSGTGYVPDPTGQVAYRGSGLQFGVPPPAKVLSYDISSVVSPTLLNEVDLSVQVPPRNILCRSEVHVVAVTDSRAYVHGHYQICRGTTWTQLHVLEVTQSGGLQEAGSYVIPFYSPFEILGHVAVSGQFAYLSGRGYLGHPDSNFALVNFSDPVSPTVVSTISGWSPKEAAVAGNTLYGQDETGSLRIYDISTPSAPRLIGTYPQLFETFLPIATRAANLGW